MKESTTQPIVETRKPKSQKRFLFEPFLNFIKPSAYIESVADINAKVLKQQGKKLIICDLDNTLVPHFTKYPTKLAFDFVDSVKDAGLDFVLLSNNSSKRVSFFAEKLGVDKYISGAKKPFPYKIRKVMKELGYTEKETILIGDMIIMDMWAANWLNADSILVKPLIDPEQTWKRILNWIESKVFLKLTKENLLTRDEKIDKGIYGGKYEEL